MELPIHFFSWLLSVLPLALLIYLLVVKKWPAYRAAPTAFLVCVVTALVYFRCSIPLLAMESAKGIWNAMVILLVVFSAVFLYELSSTAGAFDAMKVALRGLTSHELLVILMMGYVFPSFLQGITGFGVAVAVGAPLLVGIGVHPLWAVVSVLLAHSWGGTFGTLALAWSALLEQSGISQALYGDTALIAALLIWIVNFTGAVCICWFYGKWEGMKEGLPAAALISLIHGGGQILMAQINDTLACFLPATAALLAVLLLSRTPKYRRAWQIEGSVMMDRSKSSTDPKASIGFHRAFSPYYFLAFTALTCLLISPVHRVLKSVTFSFAFPAGTTGWNYTTPAVDVFSPFAPFTHPSFYLLLSCVFSIAIFHSTGRMTRAAVSQALSRTLKKAVPSGISVLFFILTSKIMGCSGQIEILAQCFVRILGNYYSLFAPLIGLLGSFITSSNMASNILFGKFQLTTATLLGQSSTLFLGAQTAGGAVGNAICPGNVVLGCATTDLLGSEGVILRKVLPIVGATALLCGGITLLIVLL